MTTISFVAGMLPLLLGAGPGAEERRSIAVLAAGGQTLSLALTLLATPVIYSLLDDLATLLHRKSAVDASPKRIHVMPSAAASGLHAAEPAHPSVAASLAAESIVSPLPHENGNGATSGKHGAPLADRN